MQQNESTTPMTVAMLTPSILGLCLLAFSFTYEDCSWTDTIRLNVKCSTDLIDYVVFPAGIVLVASALLIPILHEKYKSKIDLPKIVE